MEKLHQNQMIPTKKRTVVAIVERVKDAVVEGRLVFNRHRFYRASWDLEGKILPNRNGLGSEFSLLLEVH